MNQTPHEATPTAGGQRDKAHEAEALLAGTLALMTAYAKSCCDGCRELIASKIISNLHEVSQHPSATAGFRAMALNLHGCWVRQLQALSAEVRQEEAAATARAAVTPSTVPPPRTLWHTTPETIQ